MGGHGGLNILPQKRWNVYNFDNREKVRKDEEAAARDEHVRQQQQRLKDSDARLCKLRDAVLAKQRGGPTHANHINSNTDETPNNADEPTDETLTNTDETLTKTLQHDEEVQHMKLFHGLVSFKKLPPGSAASEEYKGPNEVDKKIFKGDKELERLYKRAAKEATRVGKDGVEADDEHYKLGYGCLDRNRKRPWYLMKSSLEEESESSVAKEKVRPEKKQKKTIAELREERLKREQQERQRAQTIVSVHQMAQPKSIGSSDRGRRPHYNSSFGNAR